MLGNGGWKAEVATEAKNIFRIKEDDANFTDESENNPFLLITDSCNSREMPKPNSK